MGDTGLLEPLPFDVSTFGLTPSGGEPELGYVVPMRRKRGRERGQVKGFVLVSAADYPWASKEHWWRQRDGYAYRYGHQHEVPVRRRSLAREVLGLGDGREDHRQAEHRNRRRFDNRRSNLRVVDSQAENLQNVPARHGSTRYRGVSLYRPTGRWRARAMRHSQEIYLGYYATEEEAGKAAAEWRRKNFPYANDERFDRV